MVAQEQEQGQEQRGPWVARGLDRFSRGVGTALFWLPLAMMLTTLVAVVGRYAFQFSSPAVQETVLYLHSAVIALAAGYTLERDRHVRIDFLYRNFSARTRAWVNLLGTLLLLLPFCLVILEYCIDYVSQSWRLGEVSSDAAGLPWLWLPKSMLLALPLLLMLQGLSLVLHQVAVLLSPAPNTPSASSTPSGSATHDGSPSDPGNAHGTPGGDSGGGRPRRPH